MARIRYPDKTVNDMSRKTIYLNGERVSEDRACVSIFDRGFQFGDSVYEVIRCYNGVPFLLDEHLDRLSRSLDQLGMALPRSLSDMQELCKRVAREHGLEPSVLYMQVTRGVADRSYLPPENLTATWVVYCETHRMRERRVYAQGISAAILPDIRWLRCDIKTTSLVASVLQKMRASSMEADDVLVEREGLGVVESGSGNLFVVKDGSLTTAPEGTFILSGTARRLTLKLAQEMGIEVRFAHPSRDQVYGADEVFITSTTAEVLPVSRIDAVSIGGGEPGPVTCRLMEAYRAEVTKVTGYQYER